MRTTVLNKGLLMLVICCVSSNVLKADGFFSKRYNRKMVHVKSDAVKAPKKSVIAKPLESSADVDIFAREAVTELQAPATDVPSLEAQAVNAVTPSQEKIETEQPLAETRSSEVIKMKVAAHIKQIREKDNIREMKPVLKNIRQELKAARKAQAKGGSDKLILEVILAILLPPLSVYIHEGQVNNTFWLNLILTLLFVFPGQIHALLVAFDVV